MDKEQFQQILEDTFCSMGFRCYRKNNFYYSNKELVIVINKQRGSYGGDYYYINVGFLLKCIHEDKELKYPKEYKCDLRFRFWRNFQGNEGDGFPLEILEESELRKCLEDNMAEKVLPAINGGIIKLIKSYPKLMTTVWNKDFIQYIETFRTADSYCGQKE